MSTNSSILICEKGKLESILTITARILSFDFNASSSGFKTTQPTPSPRPKPEPRSSKANDLPSFEKRLSHGQHGMVCELGS